MNQVCLFVSPSQGDNWLYPSPLTLNRQMADTGRDFCAERQFGFFLVFHGIGLELIFPWPKYSQINNDWHCMMQVAAMIEWITCKHFSQGYNFYKKIQAYIPSEVRPS